jgi:hypothetical protein
MSGSLIKNWGDTEAKSSSPQRWGIVIVVIFLQTGALASFLHGAEERRFVAHVIPYFAADVEWSMDAEGEGEAVARPGVDFHDFSLMEFVVGDEDQSSKKDVVVEVINDNSFDASIIGG